MNLLKTISSWLGFIDPVTTDRSWERLQFTGWLLMGLKLTSKDSGSVSKSALVLHSKGAVFALVDPLVKQDVR